MTKKPKKKIFHTLPDSFVNTGTGIPGKLRPPSLIVQPKHTYLEAGLRSSTVSRTRVTGRPLVV